VSPAYYFKARRLNGVRAELRDGDPASTSVQAVALRWGFWHLGQFSVDYRRHFGELPSVTLRTRGAGGVVTPRA
jgi:AraC family ethanolamine operon transcriptional activator